jgi:hypothetical protein
MKLSQVVGRYFDAWINRGSWSSRHPLDTKRFYRFVKAVARYNRRKVPSPDDIYALIVERWRDQVKDSDELDRIASEFAGLYQTLLNYEKTRHFPDPVIERTDIVKYHLTLSVREQEDYQRINKRMIEDWGEDWKDKLRRERERLH